MIHFGISGDFFLEGIVEENQINKRLMVLIS